ncbi:GNAT family N-acetyltransferase [Pseudomonas sp. J452]|uniref:GNAT family N-acetyltransferase n=1 Tax=Pseudomonas sp. J452 TaxID=2898441 RepID=UPI0021ADF73B|nr:GNAT family N-acetyltransferase [Pseudomonas sp. J452]UUY07229.1 GNAT family N-acetyltransferase [Pseudomonas sp. J452]
MTDIPALLVLMRELAAFEDYLMDFAVDAQALRERAFGPGAQCQVFVAESAGVPCGYAVALLIPFTYDLRPTCLLKELYLQPEQREQGLGWQLLSGVASWAIDQGAGRMKWDVLVGNSRAERFYQRLGGRPVSKWRAYEMAEPALAQLAGQLPG